MTSVSDGQSKGKTLDQSAGKSVDKRLASLLFNHLTLTAVVIGLYPAQGNMWLALRPCPEVILVVERYVKPQLELFLPVQSTGVVTVLDQFMI